MHHANFVSYNCNTNPCTKIKSRIYQTKSGNSYTILNYDKDYICFDESDEIKQCRSIIYTNPGQFLLSYSPGSSITNIRFLEQFDNKWADIYVNEFIEGIMVNLFYDYRYNKWEIATKGAVGGEYGFFSQNIPIKKNNKTILSMFMDAFCAKGNKIMDIEALSYFSKQYSYSFVIKHPTNPIIYPIEFASLYLVAVYDINRKDKCATSIPPGMFQSWSFFQNTPILFPKQLQVYEYNDLNKLLSVLDDSTKTIPGYVATHLTSGKRSVFYHPSYTSLLKLFKLDPHFVYHYLCLRRIDLVKSYVIAVPSFRKMFYKFKEHYDEFIENLHTAYLAKFVWRNVKKVSEKYDKYINAIHREIYIPSISKTRITITRKVIRNYIMSKPPGEILYSLFYEKRFVLRQI